MQMLQFKQRELEIKEVPPRWSIGIDRRHVSAYVGVAVMAGFAAGFLVARLTAREVVSPATVSSATQTPARQGFADTQSNEFHRVTKIVRADTIEVERVGVVRLLGIETPDGKSPKEIYGAHGQRALSFAEKALLGQEVRIERDPSTDPDARGETFAYVYTRDGTLINGELVKQGLALVQSAEQFRLASDFRAFERDAMQAMRGLWGSSSSASGSAPSLTLSASPAGDDKPKSKLSPLPPSAFGANIPAISGSPVGSTEASVWVSTSDKMYHKSACEFLDKKKRSIGISQAKSESYTACSRCYASTVMKAP